MSTQTNQAVRLTKEHLGDVAELERLCFSEPWSEKALELLLSDDAIGFVCLQDGRAVAYGGMLWAVDEGQVTNVAVHPDARRHGYARAIVEAFADAARAKGAVQISLEVRQSNAAAIALYEAHGYVEVGKRKNFYRNPREDALIMIRHIN